MKIPFGKLWQMMEREDYANYLFVSITWEYYTWLPKRWGFDPGRYMSAEYINTACNLFMEKSSFDEMNKRNFQMLFTNPRAWDKLHKMTAGNAKKLFVLGRQIQKLKPESLTDAQLVSWIGKFQVGQAMVHDPRGPMFILETPNNIVTNYLINYLREKYRAAHRPILHPNEAFQVLTTPLVKSIWTAEREELAKISLIKNILKQRERLLAHARKYEWLEYGLQGKILDFEHFEEEIKKLPKSEAKKLADPARQISETKKKQAWLLKEYNVHPEHVKIFKIVQDAFYTRLLSKDSQFFGYYCMEPLFREFGKRTGLELEQVKYLHHNEFGPVLMGRRDMAKMISERQKYSLCISDGGKTLTWVGSDAKRIRKKLKFYEAPKVSGSGGALKGQPAYKGTAKGRVKIVNTVQEMAKMHRGNILVSHMTNPGIVPAMKQAAAIVTDLGGITCHAAIVARELKVPCIIGTKDATRVLMDGDLVEVDANKGIIRKIS